MPRRCHRIQVFPIASWQRPPSSPIRSCTFCPIVKFTSNNMLSSSPRGNIFACYNWYLLCLLLIAHRGNVRFNRVWTRMHNVIPSIVRLWMFIDMKEWMSLIFYQSIVLTCVLKIFIDGQIILKMGHEFLMRFFQNFFLSSDFQLRLQRFIVKNYSRLFNEYYLRER